MRPTSAPLALCFLTVLCGCGGSGPPTPAPPPRGQHAMAHLPGSIAAWADGAMLFEGLGNTHRTITTSSAQAQRYFDQGMILMWGFNHDEATRSFARAAQLDPHCAACFWGVSLTVGPNYNLPFLSRERAAVAFEARRRAESEAAHASPVERALIAALARRYPDARPLDPNTALPVLTQYANAMQAVAQSFPDDLAVQTLHAESLMNLHAWKLWNPDGTPAPGTAEVLAVLEGVLARDPRHPGANHYYVHAMEASPHPERAVTAAERLRELVPGAGHLVHMPAHIFQRIGRYEDAAQANRLAARADVRYYASTRPPDYYPVMYTAHNYQFLAYSAAMEGRRAETIDAVEHSRSAVSDAMLMEMPGTDWYVAEWYTARVRFGVWDDLLRAAEPDSRLPGLLGGWLYGRAMAQAATGHLADARELLTRLNGLARGLPADTPAGQNQLRDVLAVAAPMVEARIARAEGRPADEVAWLRKAVAAEDRISYDEPRDWFTPTRQSLGAALLRSGQPREAEAAFREDLMQNPGNGWALHGLRAALEAQGRHAEAAGVARELEAAWRHADIAVTAPDS